MRTCREHLALLPVLRVNGEIILLIPARVVVQTVSLAPTLNLITANLASIYQQLRTVSLVLLTALPARELLTTVPTPTVLSISCSLTTHVCQLVP